MPPYPLNYTFQADATPWIAKSDRSYVKGIDWVGAGP